uniref:Uncharacterized protein n=1 Tax=Mycena chlorophos TaxID=658473 RepID=A0ABQ0LV45_MYCCL|nr:predicted protein [Mycena chlorophos]
MVLDFADDDKLYLYGALGSSSETSDLVLSLLVSIDGASQSPVNPISAPPGTLSTNNLIYQSRPQNAGTHSFDFIYTGGPQLGVDYFLLIGGTVISTGSGTGSGTGTGLTTALDGTPTTGSASGSGSLSVALTDGASLTSSASATSSLARASASLGGVVAGNTGSSTADSALSGSAAITAIASLQKHSTNTIAGAIVGFLLLLFLLGGGFIWLCGRGRKAADTRERIAWEQQQPQPHELVITGSYFVAGELSRPLTHHRDSLATLTNDELLAANGLMQKGEFPDEKDGYLFYEE